MASSLGDKGRSYLPILLDVSGRRAVVIGCDARTAGAVRELLAAGALVTLIAGGPGVPEFAEPGRDGLVVELRGYVRGDLAGASVAMCFFDDEELQRAVAAEAESVGCIVYVAGMRQLSSFSWPDLQPETSE